MYYYEIRKRCQGFVKGFDQHKPGPGIVNLRGAAAHIILSDRPVVLKFIYYDLISDTTKTYASFKIESVCHARGSNLF
jgi:hypothetical protein